MIQLKQNNDIIYQGFTLTKDGIEAVGTPTFKQWEEVGKFISRSHESVKFWRGDWLNYGENHYDEWSQYFDGDELAAESLKKEKWVAKRIPSGRRRPTLSWSHHEEVADLEPEEQDAMFNLAETNKLSEHQFRKAVRSYKLRLDLSELPNEKLVPTDPKVFEQVQEIINSSIHTIELLEDLNWNLVHKDAQDFFVSHLKRATGFYLSILKRYDKQK